MLRTTARRVAGASARTRRLLASLGVFAVVAAVTASPAAAVKFGTPDAADAYPWVGMMVAFDADGQPLGACSGSLLSQSRFLTAAHCVSAPWAPAQYQPAEARIWFTNAVIPWDPQFDANFAKLIAHPDEDVDLCAGVSGFPCGGHDASGTPRAHPGWGVTVRPQSSDVGVVDELAWVGDRPATFGRLAPAGYLDALPPEGGKGNVEFTVAGFGLQSVRPVVSDINQRMIGTVSLVNMKSALTDGWNVQVSNNPGQGHGGSGGTCFGDSGGPLIGDDPRLGKVIVAVNSFTLNHNCAGSNFAYRVDTPYAQAFVLGQPALLP